jgi:hemolysin D
MKTMNTSSLSLGGSWHARAVLYIVCGLVLSLIAMAFFTKVDIVATAPGRLVPAGQIKTLQAVEGGRVVEILVKEGERVLKDQPMIRLDPSLSNADVSSLQTQAQLQQLTIDRVQAELSGRSLSSKGQYSDVLLAQIEAHFQARRLAQQQAMVQEKQALNRARHDLSSAEHLMQKLRETLPLYQTNERSFAELAKSGFVSTVAASDKQRERVEKERDMQAQEAAVASAKAAVEQSLARQAQVLATYQSQLHAEKALAQQELAKVAGELAKQTTRSAWTELRAPATGIAKDLATYTPGAIVPSGAVLLTIVPMEEELVAEVQMNNEDIGLAKEGDLVQLKLLAFPFQKYGLVEGTVSRISADSASPTNAEAQRIGALAGPPPQTYRAIVKLKRQEFRGADGVGRALTPGMQVIAEIHQGKRSVVEYLLSPLIAIKQQAGRER